MIVRNLFSFGLIALFQLVCNTCESSADELAAGPSVKQFRVARSVLAAGWEHEEPTVLRRRKRESASEEAATESEGEGEKEEKPSVAGRGVAPVKAKTEEATEKPCKEGKNDKKKKKGKKGGKKGGKKNKKKG